MPIGDTNLIYTADLVRGIDVLKVTLPGQGGTPAGPPNNPGGNGGDGGGNRGGGGGGAGTGLGGLGNTAGGAGLPATGGGLAYLLLGSLTLGGAALIGRRRR